MDAEEMASEIAELKQREDSALEVLIDLAIEAGRTRLALTLLAYRSRLWEIA